MVMFTFPFVDQKYPFWANLIQNNQNCLFKQEFGTLSTLNVLNSMALLTFSVLDREGSFLRVLSKKSIWHFYVNY